MVDYDVDQMEEDAGANLKGNKYIQKRASAIEDYDDGGIPAFDGGIEEKLPPPSLQR